MKNSFIELGRFLACLMIFSFHAGGRFHSGWIFVEYFYILSGYFTVRYICNNEKLLLKDSFQPLRYTFNKIKRLLPYTSVAIIADFFIKSVIYKLSVKEMLLYFIYLPQNLMLTTGTGTMPYGAKISDTMYTPHMMADWLWYICALVVAMPVMIYLLLYLKKKLSGWLVTFFPMILYGYIIVTDGTINGWHDGMKGFLTIDLRALAGLFIGAAAYFLADYIKKKKYTKLGKTILTIIEITGFMSIVLLASLSSMHYEIFAIMVFTLVVAITLSGRSYTSNVHIGVFDYLGSLSLPVYCIHCLVIMWCNYKGIFTHPGYGLLSILCIAIICAMVLMLIVNMLKKPAKIVYNGIKKAFIADYDM